jgi:pimeloyl-ACP methyl ester carboxylesterase
MSRFTIGILAPLVGLVAGCAALPATETGRIDQQRIEFAQLGQGSPVVVFENGLGAPMRSWNKVFPEIGKHTTAFAYHRPDYGDSDPASTPRDGAHIVDELRALLRSRGLAPPYVLVGHSLGGLYMQLFARKYPDEVAGLVLVDSTHPTQMEGAGRIENQPWWARMFFHLFVNGELRREFDAVAATGVGIERDRPAARRGGASRQPQACRLRAPLSGGSGAMGEERAFHPVGQAGGGHRRDPRHPGGADAERDGRAD